MVTPYTVEILIVLQEGERLTRNWWRERFAWGARRAGGAYPPECPDPESALLGRVNDPDTGERLAKVTLTFPDGVALGRAREICHMLSSTLTAEGWTLRTEGRREETLTGEFTGDLAAEVGPLTYNHGRMCSNRCLTCCLATDTKWGCCGEGAAFSLADIGAALLAGGEDWVARWLAVPGEMDGVKWHPYLKGGICTFHDPSCGCTLPRDMMPLQCRTYLCMPDKLLPADVLAEYNAYVDALEEAEWFVEEHMRQQGGVEFGSPLPEVKAAAAKAFAAWEAGKGDRP